MLDAHCHLDRYKDPVKVAEESAARGVFTIAVTNLPSHFLAGLPHVRNLKGVRLALGLHPLAAAGNEQERSTFQESLHLTSYVGEIGLDFSREGKDSRDTQIETFRFIAKLLQNQRKVISVHSRGAESAVLDILTEFNIQTAIFHWYTGSLSTLDEVASRGHFFSINPAMASSTKGREVISRIPPRQLLTETDGPYAKINGRPAQPWDVQQVENYLSKVWAVPLVEVQEYVWANFLDLLSLLEILT